MRQKRGGVNINLEQGFLSPQEELLELIKNNKSFKIGLPNEQDKFENRISLTPQAVEILVKNGHQIFIEKNAGLASNYKDYQYSEVGATIVKTKKEVYTSDIVMQVSPFTSDEIDILKGNQLIISSLHLKSQTKENINKLIRKKITAIAHEFVRDQDGYLTVVRSMSEIAGNSAIIIAAEYLSKSHGGKGVLLGGITGITPTEVVILGAGTAGEFAARTALGLGAIIRIFDNSIFRLRRLNDHLKGKIITSVFHPHVLAKALLSADVVIGALRNDDNMCYPPVTETMVKSMKEGSVIVDLSIDNGACFETSSLTNHKKPTFLKHNVLHYCVPNVPSHVSRTSTLALSNIFSPLLSLLAYAGGVDQIIRNDIGVRSGVYVYKGILTNKKVGDVLGLMSKDINLLLAAF